jgi:hypothetical protein
MRDNLRRYRARREACTPWYPGPPSGTVARPLRTLAARLSGIGGRTSPHLPHMAAQVPHGTKPDRRVKRLARWLDHAHLLAEVYLLPYAESLLPPLAWQPVVRVMDGRGVGRGCTALLLHVVSTGRALPRAWRVRHASQGHVPDDLHIALVELVRELSPAGTQVVCLGDGEGEGITRQETRHEAGWGSACRTSPGNTATWEDETLHVAEWGACRTPGRLIARKEGAVTREA